MNKLTLPAIALVALTLCLSVAPTAAASDSLPNLVSAPLQNPVILDGAISSPSEWADVTPITVSLGVFTGSLPLVAPYVPAEIWSKHDSVWVYFLFRITWPSNETDKSDTGRVEYFWSKSGTQYSDLGSVSYANETHDGYGCCHDGTLFYMDTDAGGKNNVEGATTYDGTHYWFEFRKALNSNDGHDWALVVGHTYGLENGADIYGGHFSVGLFQTSKKIVHVAFVTLDLSSTPVPEFNSIDLMAFLALAASIFTLRRSRRVIPRQRSSSRPPENS